jgi:hypothetical protein
MRESLPLSAAVQHFTNTLADVASAFGICFQAARNDRMFQRFFHAQENWFRGEEPFLDMNRIGKRLSLVL